MSKQREAFEAAFEAMLMPAESDWFKRDNDDPEEYFWPSTHYAWLVWQASRAATLNEAAIEVERHYSYDPEARDIAAYMRALKEQS